MTVQVLHAVPYTHDPDQNTQYRSVGLVETPDGLDLPGRLEYAFNATQNVDEAWSEQGLRSTSVGDRMWIDNELWQVFGIGWGRVDL